MRIKLIKPVDLTGVMTAPGTILDVTPEYARELVLSGQAEEIGLLRKIAERIEKAVERKPEENRIKHKDN